jgi:cholesterol oxidase
VLLRKDERWFVQEDLDAGGYEYWPVTRAELDPHYDRVEAMMRPQRYPFDHAPYDATPKTRAFKGAAEQLGLDFQFPPLAVTFANDGSPPVPGEEIPEPEPNLHGAKRYTCRLVAECDLGCNWGSKNSLDYTYLSAAHRLGAELRTRCEAKRLAPLEGGGYRVGYTAHADDPADSVEREVTGDRLILSAGTLGTTLLLLRNRDAFPGLSDRLGTRFSGNGDLLTFAVRCREDRNGKRVPRLIDAARGTVITSTIRVPDALDGGEGRGFYLQDAGYPGFANWMVQTAQAPSSLWTAATVFWRLARHSLLGDPESNLSAEAAAILGDCEVSAGSMPLLGMGRDFPDGTMRLTKKNKLDVDWRKKKSDAYFDRVRETARRMAEAMGAEEFKDNPIWHLRRLITVHALGGAPMGRSADEGVIDPFGRAFGHPGLHIADGSVMPGPVGANPSLTIAALADRFADALIDDRPVGAPAAAVRRPATGNGSVAVSFTEEMKGFVTFGETDYDRGFRAGRESKTALMFHLTITADDLDQFAENPDHVARAEGWVECEARGGRLPVQAGVFNLFVEHEGDRRRKRMRYLLPFIDGTGAPLTLKGFKVVENDPGLDLWSDTTTLFTHVLEGHARNWDDDLPVAAAGLIHIHLSDFAKQLTTFRTDPPGRLDAVARFGKLFADDLWEVYGPR